MKQAPGGLLWHAGGRLGTSDCRPSPGLVVGAGAAAGSAMLAAWPAPTLALGDDGMRMRDTLRAFVLARLRPARAGGSA